MAEKIEVMADSFGTQAVPSVPVSIAPSYGVTGFSCATPIHPERVNLSHRDLRKLNLLVKEEGEAKKEFETAMKRRNRFCLELEQRHALAGLKWAVDQDQGQIVIIGKKDASFQPPQQP